MDAVASLITKVVHDDVILSNQFSFNLYLSVASEFICELSRLGVWNVRTDNPITNEFFVFVSILVRNSVKYRNNYCRYVFIAGARHTDKYTDYYRYLFQ